MEQILLNNNRLYKFLYVLVIVISILFSSETRYAMLIILVYFTLIINRFSMERKMLRIVLPLLGITLIGLIGSYGKNSRDVIRDFFYFTNPILIIIFSYTASSEIRDMRFIFKSILYYALAISLIHISKFLFNPGLIFSGIRNIRLVAGTDSYIEIVGLMLLLFEKKYSLDFEIRSGKIKGLLKIIYITSIVLYFSRVMLFSFLVFIFLFMYTKEVRNRYVYLFVIILSIVIALSFMKSSNNVTINSFYNKIIHSLSEIKAENYFSEEEINDNWRGYETYLAKEKYQTGSISQKTLGFGMGTSIVLITEYGLGKKYDALPIIHNGYMYTIIKAGISGLILYALFIINLLGTRLRNREYSREQLFLRKFIIAFTFIIIFTTYVVTGIYNKSGLFEILYFLGSFIFMLNETEFYNR